MSDPFKMEATSSPPSFTYWVKDLMYFLQLEKINDGVISVKYQLLKKKKKKKKSIVIN